MVARATATRESVARSFAPGHLTMVFVPSLAARDPRGRGSIGAGIVLELGARATARWRPGGRGPRVSVTSRGHEAMPISNEVAARLLGHRRGRLAVEIVHELPVGQGFGMSAAGALATALAVARVLRVPHRRAVEVAHLADLFGGGGLGGVAAILGGGLERRVRAGVPPRGEVRHRPLDLPVLIAAVGRGLPSPRYLRRARFLARVERAGRPLVRSLGPTPTAAAVLSAGERFTDSLGLAAPGLRVRLARLRTLGARAGQTMLGSSVWIVPRTRPARARVLRALAEWNVSALELRAAPTGARVLRP